MHETVLDLLRQQGGPLPIEEVWAANVMTPEEIVQWRQDCEAARKKASAEQEARRQEALAKHLAQKLAICQIPEGFRPVAPDTRYDADLQMGRGLYVSGPRGTGKTTKACAVAKAWVIRHGATALFATASGMLTDINGSHHDGRGEEAATRRYEQARLLVIDDIDKRVATPGAVSKIFEIADSRWSGKRPTIWTSQIGLDELAGRLAQAGGNETADALASRIAGSSAIVRTSGADMRMRR